MRGLFGSIVARFRVHCATGSVLSEPALKGPGADRQAEGGQGSLKAFTVSSQSRAFWWGGVIHVAGLVLPVRRNFVSWEGSAYSRDALYPGLGVICPMRRAIASQE